MRAAASALALLLASAVPATAITVPGTANPKLAGMPDGTTASSGDVAPAQSPVLFTLGGPTVVGITFSVTGAVNFVPSAPAAGQGPDGDLGALASNFAENGISGMFAPASALMGVFLDGTQPDGTPAPPRLDFWTSAASRDFATLSPLLKQVFFIGDGLTSASATQLFNVPMNATRLFLGTSDGFGWFNNFGTFDVTVLQIVTDPGTVPAPAALGLFGLGLAGLLASRRRAA